VLLLVELLLLLMELLCSLGYCCLLGQVCWHLLCHPQQQQQQPAHLGCC
jgi:hypothetical protein